MDTEYVATTQMAENSHYKATVGFITILSGIVGFICFYLSAAAVNFNLEYFSNPELMFIPNGVHTGILRWSLIADLFGYYLLLLPALFYIHHWLQGKTPWRNLITFCGMSYILIGSVGASVLSVTWTSFLTKFPVSTPEQQETIKLLFDTFSQMVYGGMWNLFDALTGGIWWIGIGIFICTVKRFLGWLTIILGVITLLDSFANILEIKVMAENALNLYLVLAPIWAIVLGVSILKSSFINKSSQE
jgi:hypothetical protein